MQKLRFLMAAALVALMLVLAGCGGGGGSSTTTDTTQDDTPQDTDTTADIDTNTEAVVNSSDPELAADVTVAFAQLETSERNAVAVIFENSSDTSVQSANTAVSAAASAGLTSSDVSDAHTEAAARSRAITSSSPNYAAYAALVEAFVALKAANSAVFSAYGTLVDSMDDDEFEAIANVMEKADETGYETFDTFVKEELGDIVADAPEAEDADEAIATVAVVGGDGSDTVERGVVGTRSLEIAKRVSVVDSTEDAARISDHPLGRILMRAIDVDSFDDDTDYNQDETQVWVNDRSSESFEIINEILCSFNQTRYDKMVNKGPYIAQIDIKLCEQNTADNKSATQSGEGKQDVTVPEYEYWVVDSIRESDDSYQVIHAWIPNEEEYGEDFTTEEVIMARVVIYEGKSEEYPNGIFTINFKQAPFLNDGTKQIDPASKEGFTGILKSFVNTSGENLISFTMEHQMELPEEFYTSMGIEDQGYKMEMIEKVIMSKNSDGSGRGATYMKESFPDFVWSDDNTAGGDTFGDDTAGGGTTTGDTGPDSEDDFDYETYFADNQCALDILSVCEQTIDTECTDDSTFDTCEDTIISACKEDLASECDVTLPDAVADSREGTFTMKTEESKYNIAFNDTHFLRQDMLESEEELACYDRLNPKRNVYRYGLYNSDGSRKNLRSGLPIGFEEEGELRTGWLGFWGVHIDGSDGNVDQYDGQVVYPFNWADYSIDETGDSYTINVYPGKLKKVTRDVTTLDKIKNIQFNYWDDSTGYEYRIEWDGTGFLVSAIRNQNDWTWDETGYESGTEYLDVSEMNWPEIYVWSEALNGSVKLDLNGTSTDATATPKCTEPNWQTTYTYNCTEALDGTVPVVVYKEAIVQPGSDAAAAAEALGSLVCYDNCPDPDPADPYNPYFQTYTWDDQTYEEVWSPVTYNFSETEMALQYQGVNVAAPAEMQGGSIWSGALIRPDDVDQLACDWDANQICAWMAESRLSSFYRWESGSDSWNKLVAVTNNTTSEVEDFDQPLSVEYEHTYDNSTKTFVLNYEGFGNLYGIPETCEDGETGEAIDCPWLTGEEYDGWVRVISEFAIPAGASATYFDPNSEQDVEVVIKPLEEEHFMRANVDESACTDSGLAITVDYTAQFVPLYNWKDPYTSGMGEIPYDDLISDDPAVIAGEVQ